MPSSPSYVPSATGLIISISSTGGINGLAFVSAYSAAKFAIEGWMESLA